MLFDQFLIDREINFTYFSGVVDFWHSFIFISGLLYSLFISI